jgi:hypothetical protein
MIKENLSLSTWQTMLKLGNSLLGKHALSVEKEKHVAEKSSASALKVSK